MIVFPAVMVFRALASIAFAAGLGSLAAGVVARALATNDTFEWLASLPAFAIRLAAALLPASIGASLVMPQRAALVREIRGEEDPPPGSLLTLLLVVLCGLAVLQIPGILTWWQEDRAFLRSMLPDAPDPLGFNYVPTALALSLPTLALLTLLLFVLTSLFSIVVPSKLAPRVVSSCVILQVGYVLAAFIVIAEVRVIGAALSQLLSKEDSPEMRAVTDWIGRHVVSATGTSYRLVGTCLGYVVAAFVAYRSPAAAGRNAVLMPGVDPGPGESVAAVLVSQPRVLPASAAAAVFNESNYSVHPRMTLVESWLTRKCTNFEIRTIPPRSRSWFSFSWQTGALRQEPDGPDLLVIKPPRPPGLFLDRDYEVIDSRTGQGMARFIPRGADWEIANPTGEIAARVLRDTSGSGFVRYRGFVGDDEVCQFKWALAGLSTASAQLEIVFPSEATAPIFDRALAVAIAPLLEQKARLASERSRSG